MKLTRDEPGELVVLEETRPIARRTGPWWFWGLGFLVSAWLVGRWLLGAEPSPFRTLILLAPLWAFLVVLQGTLWRVRLLRIDAEIGELLVVEASPVSWRERETRIRLSELGGLDVLSKTYSAEVILRPTSGSTRKLETSLEGATTPEKGLAFAHRLARAAGFPYQRIVVADPLLVHFRRAPGPGLESLPGAGAGESGAHRNPPFVAAKGAVAEHGAPFDPTQFPSDHKITRWTPGQEVRLQKPVGGATLGCLPVGLAALSIGPATFFSMRQRSASDALLFGVAVGFFGLLLAALPLWIAYTELPRLVVIDWTTRTILIRRGFERTLIDFSEITALELQRDHGEHLRNNSPETARAWHHSSLQVHVRDKDGQKRKPVELVRGRDYENDAETPYRQALPLVTELAAAMGVPKRVADRSYRE